MKEIEIDYVTEDPGKLYAKAVRSAQTRKELIDAIEPYVRIADDALATAKAMTYTDFDDFARDIAKASRKQSEAWVKKFNDRFGAIAMPAKMMIATLLASQFHTPWGTAVIRCEEEGWPMLQK